MCSCAYACLCVFVCLYMVGIGKHKHLQIFKNVFFFRNVYMRLWVWVCVYASVCLSLCLKMLVEVEKIDLSLISFVSKWFNEYTSKKSMYAFRNMYVYACVCLSVYAHECAWKWKHDIMCVKIMQWICFLKKYVCF